MTLHGAKVQLVLYVVSRSPRCERAIEEVLSAVHAFDRGTVTLEVRNLSRVERTTDDRTILTVPTLVMTQPSRAYLIHDLSRGAVIAFIESSGLSRPQRLG